jgi:hypothetical protein
MLKPASIECTSEKGRREYKDSRNALIERERRQQQRLKIAQTRRCFCELKKAF